MWYIIRMESQQPFQGFIFNKSFYVNEVYTCNVFVVIIITKCHKLTVASIMY